eukprot:TRINITY_DN778099_c0_g1_i1.p1 TRINITY_DN778099_c0_g1~~TRINITY_DN778099_c0_g1_i1.p1  ORF type:complete len:284 (+),score=55.00 TRINITY_DN778099_c0_g1_i1:99-950(+)
MESVFQNNVERLLALPIVVGLASFICINFLVTGFVKDPFKGLRRVVKWMRMTAFLSLPVQLFILHYAIERSWALSWPYFGLGRPIVALFLSLDGLILHYHPVLRLFSIIGQPLLIFVDCSSFVYDHRTLQCRIDGTCQSHDGFTKDELIRILMLFMIAMLLEVWLFCKAVIISSALGLCEQRISPRLFSTTDPFHRLPDSARLEHAQGGGNIAKLEDDKETNNNSNNKKKKTNNDDSEDSFDSQDFDDGLSLSGISQVSGVSLLKDDYSEAEPLGSKLSLSLV